MLTILIVWILIDILSELEATRRDMRRGHDEIRREVKSVPKAAPKPTPIEDDDFGVFLRSPKRLRARRTEPDGTTTDVECLWGEEDG